MRVTKLVLLSVALGCLVWLSAIPARADYVPPPLPPPLPPSYQVTGALLIVGNPVCSGLPCTETYAFSFDVGYQFVPVFNYYEAYFTDLQVSGSGDLGSFTGSDPGPAPFQASIEASGPCSSSRSDDNFLGFGAFGAGVNLHLCQGVAPAPVAPSIVGGDLYECDTMTCAIDFSQFPSARLPQSGLFLFGPVQYTVTTIPEPATLSLLVCGLLALGLGATSKKFLAFE